MAFGDRLINLSQKLDEQRRAEQAVVAARMLIQRLRSAGHEVALTGEDGIRVSPRPDDATAERLKATKPYVLQVLRAQAPKP